MQVEIKNGRMKVCRGVEASLSEEEISAWERAHRKLLLEIAPEEFNILHYGAIAELRKNEFVSTWPQNLYSHWKFVILRQVKRYLKE